MSYSQNECWLSNCWDRKDAISGLWVWREPGKMTRDINGISMICRCSISGSSRMVGASRCIASVLRIVEPAQVELQTLQQCPCGGWSTQLWALNSKQFHDHSVKSLMRRLPRTWCRWIGATSCQKSRSLLLLQEMISCLFLAWLQHGIESLANTLFFCNPQMIQQV